MKQKTLLWSVIAFAVMTVAFLIGGCDMPTSSSSDDSPIPEPSAESNDPLRGIMNKSTADAVFDW
jgi:hypothetical protein